MLPRRQGGPDKEDNYLHVLSKPCHLSFWTQDMSPSCDKAASAEPPKGSIHDAVSHPNKVHIRCKHAAPAGCQTRPCCGPGSTPHADYGRRRRAFVPMALAMGFCFPPSYLMSLRERTSHFFELYSDSLSTPSLKRALSWRNSLVASSTCDRGLPITTALALLNSS